MEPDGNCLFNAILQQIHHDKEKYTPDHLRRQTALHMLKYADIFYEYVAHDLIDFDESYKSYVTNIFNGKIWGDDLMASAIVHMFNIPISIVSPEMPHFHSSGSQFDSQPHFHSEGIPIRSQISY